MKEIIPVDLGDRSYQVEIGNRLFDTAGEDLEKFVGSSRVMVIYDQSVESPWFLQLEKQLAKLDVDVCRFKVSSGEKSKSAETLAEIWETCAENNLTRDSLIIALGGGVIGDLGGFVAGSFLRGIDFIQVPTSLLAMVDSSVGGKTGINLKRGKNLVGAFWQPVHVMADISTLGTLPDRELRAGLAEVIKYGVIYDAEFFEYLEENMHKVLEPAGDLEVMTHLIKRSVEIKADVVRQDEREGGLRRILNFGHTIGHAIETVGKYTQLIHGEAISIGMVAASKITLGLDIGNWSEDDHQRLVALIEKAGLPTQIPENMAAQELIDRTLVDKKAVKGKVRYVLPTKMGTIKTVSDIKMDLIESVLIELGANQSQLSSA